MRGRRGKERKNRAIPEGVITGEPLSNCKSAGRSAWGSNAFGKEGQIRKRTKSERKEKQTLQNVEKKK